MSEQKSGDNREHAAEEVVTLLTKLTQLEEKQSAAAVEQSDLARQRTETTSNLALYSLKTAENAEKQTGLAQERTALTREQTRLSTRSSELANIRTELAQERSFLAEDRTRLAGRVSIARTTASPTGDKSCCSATEQRRTVPNMTAMIRHGCGFSRMCLGWLPSASQA